MSDLSPKMRRNCFGFSSELNGRSRVPAPPARMSAVRVMRSAIVDAHQMAEHETNETLRKALHIAFGLFAVALLWLPWRIAAGIAVLAVIGNWLVLHRVFGRGVARHERGWDEGIV